MSESTNSLGALSRAESSLLGALGAAADALDAVGTDALEQALARVDAAAAAVRRDSRRKSRRSATSTSSR